ncbi:GerMN domain-containing protein [Desulfosporosinus sp. SB140]|uniref:GerMN domain-containing protein n=1 Tax=Desulfosporosinus paludis TaxID=3115649 RepID=UPI00388CF7F2
MTMKVRYSILVGVIIVSLLYLTGCGTLETLVNKDGSGSSFGNFIGGDKTQTVPADAPATTSADAQVITLYFADSTGKYLVKEQRTLPKTLSVARETVIQWLKGPAAKGTATQAAVPTTTTLLDIAIKNNMAVVDLSKEFLQPNSKVSPEVALYGLVDTLTQYSTIKQVQIRIEGKPLTKYGTVDCTKLVNKPSLVKGSTSSEPIFPSTGSSTGVSNSLNSGTSAGTNNDININTSGQSAGQTSGTSGSSPDSSNGALPNSPSSINLFNYPPSST